MDPKGAAESISMDPKRDSILFGGPGAGPGAPRREVQRGKYAKFAALGP